MLTGKMFNIILETIYFPIFFRYGIFMSEDRVGACLVPIKYEKQEARISFDDWKNPEIPDKSLKIFCGIIFS